MIDRWILLAAGLIVLVLVSYGALISIDFVPRTRDGLGQLGDYFGGVLNPILAFVSIVLIVKSMNLQIDANKEIKSEITRLKKAEGLRAFENKFFNMLKVQDAAFKEFNLTLKEGSLSTTYERSAAVAAIEDKIENCRSEDDSNSVIRNFLRECDSHDQIFSAARTFYICVKYIIEHLSDDLNFSQEDRKEYIKTLINFTEFSLVRLNMISLQFMDYQSVGYLKKCDDFNRVLKDFNIDYESY